VIAIRRVWRGENAIDFRPWWKRVLVLSAILVLISVVSLFTRGLNLGIDFEGGTSWEVPAAGVSVAEARDVLGPLGEGSAKIQVVSTPGGNDVLRVQSDTDDPARQGEVRAVLAELAGAPEADVSISTVGPSWGQEITRSALRALAVFLVVLVIYLSIRLQWAMAVAALVALAHDLLISVGVYSVFQLEVTPGTVVALLTIMGYSIYDTVVVFDKVKENEPKVGVANRLGYSEMVSLSMNEVLVRSINTTITSLLPVVAILVVGSLILGATSLQEFGIALLIGLLVGAYSSILIASPVLNFIKERQHRYKVVRERIEASRPANPVSGGPSSSVGGPLGAPAGVEGTSGAGSSAGSPSTRPAPTPTGAIPPRPRKKGKRR
jgi:preprotein translocase subunit SecF